MTPKTPKQMSYIKTLLSRNLLKPSINPNNFPQFHKSWSNFFSTQIQNPLFYPSKRQKLPKIKKNKRPLDVVFKESLGLCEKVETLANWNEKNDENGELLKKLFDLENEIIQLKAKSPSKEENVGNLMGIEMGLKGKDDGFLKAKPRNLNALFGREVEEGGKNVVFNEISKDMQMFLRHMYECGYFKDVNFLPGNRFDMSCFYEDYAREYVKFALQRFGNDHKDISKWLSGSDAKAIAQFGCPTLIKGDVMAAKTLRHFFKIREETVCAKCVLNESCKHRNSGSGKGDNATLRLDSLLRLLRAYSLNEISPPLMLTDDMKDCVSRLIHEVMNLTKDAGQAVDKLTLS